MANKEIDTMIRRITKQIDDANLKVMNLQTYINEQKSILEKLNRIKAKYAEADREMEKIISDSANKKQKDVKPDAEGN